MAGQEFHADALIDQVVFNADIPGERGRSPGRNPDLKSGPYGVLDLQGNGSTHHVGEEIQKDLSNVDSVADEWFWPFRVVEEMDSMRSAFGAP